MESLGVCELTKTGGTYTDAQRQAVAAMFGSEAEMSYLESLYRDCATRKPGFIVALEKNERLPVSATSSARGMQVLCPDHPAQVDLVHLIEGRIISDGTYRVGSEVQPGTYAIEAPISGCYWERTDDVGGTVENAFINAAVRVQVTIAASDYSFHSERCGNWRLLSE